MKNILLIVLLTFSVFSVKAQSRKNLGSFSLFQHYFNPAQTGYEGSILKTFYRDQWTGFEDAPRTLFLSGEFSMADLKYRKKKDLLQEQVDDEDVHSLGAKHALGLSLLHDTFGAFQENRLNLSYGSQVQLSKDLSLRAGAAFTYNITKVNANKLTFANELDPEYQDLLNHDNNQVNKLDMNLGLVLTADDYYLGYALQDITRGKIISTDNSYLEGTYFIQHVVQAGYRRSLSEQLGLVFNGIYHYDKNLKETIEGQLKAVMQNTFWAGVGYRKDLAYSFNAGLHLKHLQIGYVREVVSSKAEGINTGTNEIMLCYPLIPVKETKETRELAIW